MTLRATGLRKSYNGITVVEDISMHVELGEIVGLLGPNGAGKTTCFYTIVGLVRADSGQVFIDKTELTDAAMHQRAAAGLGYLPQESSIFKGLTVEKNIQAILELKIKDKRDRRRKLEELLGDFSITHLRQAKANNLSGGERRRVEIARCLASQPNYILLDEPFAGVDPIAIDDIRSLVSQLKTRNLGIFITDHNVRETLKIVDKAYIIHEGKIIKHGKPDFVVNDPSVRRVYLGEKFSL